MVKLQKHHITIDPRQDSMMLMLASLSEFRQKWIDKEGALPEEIDARCVDMTGMRFNLLLTTMCEAHTRLLLVKQGAIPDVFTYMPEMQVGCQTYPISKQEHKQIVSCMEQYSKTGDKVPQFLDSLSDFAI